MLFSVPEVLKLADLMQQCEFVPDSRRQVPTSDSGWGLVTRQAIGAGAFVVCYNGEVLSMAEARRRLRHNASVPGHSNYLLVLREHAGDRVYRTHIDAELIANCAR